MPRSRAVFASVLVAALVGCDLADKAFVDIVVPSYKDAIQADTTGQNDVYTGSLGEGLTCSFPAIQGVTYNISVSAKGRHDVIVDVFSNDGEKLKAKTVTTDGGLDYFHLAQSQHVLVVLRPYHPVEANIEITQFRITAIGNYSATDLSINLIVAGDDYSGFGAFDDLKTSQDRAAFAAALVAKLQALHDRNATGFRFTFEGFTLTTAQIRATQPTLLDESGHTILKTSERVGNSGGADIDTSDLDRYATFGFPGDDPVPTRANGLDCFVIHHFATNGFVGLSQRPGSALRGNGPGSAVCVSAFLENEAFIEAPRSVDEIAVALTHEIGHFLGLLHTTTFSPSPDARYVLGTIDDGLADTPAAGDVKTLAANARANGHTSIGFGDGCADQGYIMFPQSTGTQDIFSPRQVAIMKTTLSSFPH